MDKLNIACIAAPCHVSVGHAARRIQQTDIFRLLVPRLLVGGQPCAQFLIRGGLSGRVQGLLLIACAVLQNDFVLPAAYGDIILAVRYAAGKEARRTALIQTQDGKFTVAAHKSIQYCAIRVPDKGIGQIGQVISLGHAAAVTAVKIAHIQIRAVTLIVTAIHKPIEPVTHGQQHGFRHAAVPDGRHVGRAAFIRMAAAEFIAEDALLTRGKINRCGEVLASIINVHRAVDGIPAHRRAPCRVKGRKCVLHGGCFCGGLCSLHGCGGCLGGRACRHVLRRSRAGRQRQRQQTDGQPCCVFHRGYPPLFVVPPAYRRIVSGWLQLRHRRVTFYSFSSIYPICRTLCRRSPRFSLRRRRAMWVSSVRVSQPVPSSPQTVSYR